MKPVLSFNDALERACELVGLMNSLSECLMYLERAIHDEEVVRNSFDIEELDILVFVRALVCKANAKLSGFCGAVDRKRFPEEHE